MPGDPLENKEIRNYKKFEKGVDNSGTKSKPKTFSECKANRQ